MSNPVASIGRATINLVSEITGILALLADTLKWVIYGPLKGKTAKRQSVFQQMVFAGVQSLIIVFFVTFFTGVVICMQSAYQLQQLGAVIFVAPMVAISLARELSPVFVALVVAGRVGSAITAEIGTMKVSEQIEALETLALDPVRFLVVPRFLALVVMVPVLTIIGNLMGILGGLVVGVFNLKLNLYRYISFSFDLLTWKDVWTGLLKSLVFGIAIAMISCYVGLNTRGGAEGVGTATTKSVVVSFIMIILFDCILTGFFFFSNM